MYSGKRQMKKKKLGFTNKLCLYIIGLLTLTILLGFYLSLESIKYQYLGTLACWAAVTAPLDTVLSIVIHQAVIKSKEENTGADGEGIVYAKAKANGFREVATTTDDTTQASPPI